MRDAIHAIAVPVVGAHGVQQLVLVVQGVLPVGRVLSALDQRVYDVLRGLEVGRPHREIVDRAALGLKLAATHVKRGKDLVSQQAKTLRELHGHSNQPGGPVPVAHR